MAEAAHTAAEASAAALVDLEAVWVVDSEAAGQAGAGKKLKIND